MEEYNGEKDIEKFMSFCKQNAKYKFKPMSDERIKVICDAYPDKKIPKQFISFLKNAGEYFSPWSGSDYFLVDENNEFIDFREYIKEWEDDDKKFREFGFSYYECLFFWNHQGNAYYFFRLDDNYNSNNDPLVYMIVCDEIGKPRKPFHFTEMIINNYNASIKYRKEAESPWCFGTSENNPFTVQILNELNDVFSYSQNECSIKIPYEHDVYAIKNNATSKECFNVLNTLLIKSLAELDSVLIYFNGVLYIYYPGRNTQLDNSINLDVYKDKTFILDRMYKYGWFTIKDKVYVFGDKFKALIKENIDKFNLSKIY